MLCDSMWDVMGCVSRFFSLTSKSVSTWTNHSHANQTWDQQGAQVVGDRNVWILYISERYDSDRFCQNAGASAILSKDLVVHGT